MFILVRFGLRFEVILAPFLVENRPGSSEIAVEGPPEVQRASLERSGTLLERFWAPPPPPQTRDITRLG